MTPKDIACTYINKGIDQPGLEERFVNDYIGNIDIFSISIQCTHTQLVKVTYFNKVKQLNECEFILFGCRKGSIHHQALQMWGFPFTVQRQVYGCERSREKRGGIHRRNGKLYVLFPVGREDTLVSFPSFSLFFNHFHIQIFF